MCQGIESKWRIANNDKWDIMRIRISLEFVFFLVQDMETYL